MRVNGIVLDKYEKLTQAYHAGFLLAQTEHHFNVQYNFVEAMVHYYTLPEIFGSVRWMKLKTMQRFKHRVALYEALAYQPHLPKSLIGGSREFCLGFTEYYNFSRWNKTKSKYTAHAQILKSHLEKNGLATLERVEFADLQT